MLFVLRALRDPRRNCRLLDLGECSMRLRTRHHFVWIFRVDPAPHFASFKIVRLDCSDPVALCVREFRAIEAQSTLARLLVKAVAREAILRKNRANISVVIESARPRVRVGRVLQRRQRTQCNHSREHRHHSCTIKQPRMKAKRDQRELRKFRRVE